MSRWPRRSAIPKPTTRHLTFLLIQSTKKEVYSSCYPLFCFAVNQSRNIRPLNLSVPVLETFTVLKMSAEKTKKISTSAKNIFDVKQKKTKYNDTIWPFGKKKMHRNEVRSASYGNFNWANRVSYPAARTSKLVWAFRAIPLSKLLIDIVNIFFFYSTDGLRRTKKNYLTIPQTKETHFYTMHPIFEL